MAGREFGKWTVVERAAPRQGATEVFWLCRCSCGEERAVSGAGLRRGRSTSCGHPAWQDALSAEDIPEGARVCSKCLEPKQETEFYGAHQWCKVCIRGGKKKAYEERRQATGRKRRNAPKDGWKCCGKCGVWKALPEFKRTPTGWAHCLKCTTEYSRELHAGKSSDPVWAAYRADRARNNHLKRSYNMTVDDFEVMRKEQEGCCAVCGTVCENLVVDHNHETGAVRGLLCQLCNVAVGAVRESAKIAGAVGRYIEKHLTTAVA